MAKNYEEVAMDVIREDWEFRKSQHNESFNQERIARMMGISRSQFAKALGENKNPTISFICRYLTERLETYDWENECPSLTR